MSEYLLEVGTEELPASQVPEAQERLKLVLSEALRDANVKFDEITTMGTPRRLTCLVHGIAAVQDTVQRKFVGPAVKASFDAAGKPTAPAVGFAQKHGLAVDALTKEDVGGVEKLVANLTVSGKPVAQVLKDIVPASIMQLSGERLMRWGSSDLKFSRPIRWIVSLLDKDEVPVSIDAIHSGRSSYGNRVLAPAAVQVAESKSYESTLRAAKVIADPGEREAVIRKQVESVAAGVKGKPRQLGGSLLEEVVNITEWPHAVLGEFEHEYLDLPDKLIETIMIHHQRYFPVERADAEGEKKRLLPYFITVANNDRKEAEPIIKQGNERVIRARLADGRFFYFDDQKTKLAQRKEALGQLTFQEGLGSYGDKMNRLAAAARLCVDSLHLEPRIAVCLERTVELCKLDLVTSLVRELPELQGYVGSWYAEREGEPPDVVNAIASHYAPRSQHDSIPGDTVGQFAALLDKLDNLVGLFAVGRKPTGSSDPYALRRQCQGVVDIVVDGIKDIAVSLTALITVLLAEIEPALAKRKGFDREKTISEVREFLLQRVRTKLSERGYRKEIVDAVLGSYDPLVNLPDVLRRCEALQVLLASDDGTDIVRAGVRIGNILKVKQESPTHGMNPALLAAKVDEALFTEEAEKGLWRQFQAVAAEAENGLWHQFQLQVSGGSVGQACLARQYSAEEARQLLVSLKPLVVPINTFFEKVMVNDPDEGKKNNRHNVLKNIYQRYGVIADFTRLQPLLP